MILLKNNFYFPDLTPETLSVFMVEPIQETSPSVQRKRFVWQNTKSIRSSQSVTMATIYWSYYIERKKNEEKRNKTPHQKNTRNKLRDARSTQVLKSFLECPCNEGKRIAELVQLSSFKQYRSDKDKWMWTFPAVTDILSIVRLYFDEAVSSFVNHCWLSCFSFWRRIQLRY